MKSSVTTLGAALFLAVALIVVPRVQAADSSKLRTLAANDAAFTIDWQRSTPRDVVELKNHVTRMKRETEKGNLSPEEVNVLLSRMEYLQDRAPPLINVQSKGGPLSGFIAAAAKLKGISFTLINAAEPADLETPIAAFNLSNANWTTVVSVLETFLSSRGLELRLVGGDNPNFAEASSVVCVLNRTDAARAASLRATQSDFESLQLGEHIDAAQTIEAIVDAIRTAWELDPMRDPVALRLRFHPATKLLLVSGPPPASSIARQVVSSLQKKSVQR